MTVNITAVNDAPTITSGTASTNSTANYGSTTTSGGTSAYSSNDNILIMNVSSVNDAPTISAGYTYNFAGTNEDTASTGTLASSILLASTYADVDTGAQSGLAITGLTGNGTWQYSTNGSTWTNFGTVSATSSLLITATTQVRFLPDAQNGETATFTYKAWDRTLGTASINGTPNYSSTITRAARQLFRPTPIRLKSLSPV